MGSIMFLILINLICIGNNEGIHNEVQWASSPALTPSELGSTHTDPHEVRMPSRAALHLMTCNCRFRASSRMGSGEGWLWNRLAYTEQAKFPLPPPPELLVRQQTGREGGGNFFWGKQFQALAVCACMLLPTDLVLSVISPSKRMRSAARELDGLGVHGWAWTGPPLGGEASRALSQSPL